MDESPVTLVDNNPAILALKQAIADIETQHPDIEKQIERVLIYQELKKVLKNLQEDEQEASHLLKYLTPPEKKPLEVNDALWFEVYRALT